MQREHSDELHILERVSKSRIESRHPGDVHVLDLLDTFSFNGPLGEHRCLVTDVLGFDLNFFRKAQPNHLVPLPFVKRVVRQVLLGLDFLHTECNIVHAG